MVVLKALPEPVFERLTSGPAVEGGDFEFLSLSSLVTARFESVASMGDLITSNLTRTFFKHSPILAP